MEEKSIPTIPTPMGSIGGKEPNKEEIAYEESKSGTQAPETPVEEISDERKLIKLLLKCPEEPANKRAQAVWVKTGGMSLRKFKEAAPEWAPIILESDEVQYRELVNKNTDTHFFGQFKTGTDCLHGIVRVLSRNGEIFEG